MSFTDKRPAFRSSADWTPTISATRRTSRSSSSFDAQPEGEILVDAHVREDRVVLEDEADVAATRIDPADGTAVEVDLAARRPLETGDHVHRRRLPAARGPEQCDERSVHDRQVEIVHGDERSEALRQMFEPDLRHQRLIAPNVSPRTR
jgi:hypothetical protein